MKLNSNIIHYEKEGEYFCNSLGRNPEKMTKDKDKITCLNCIKRLNPKTKPPQKPNKRRFWRNIGHQIPKEKLERIRRNLRDE